MYLNKILIEFYVLPRHERIVALKENGQRNIYTKSSKTFLWWLVCDCRFSLRWNNIEPTY